MSVTGWGQRAARLLVGRPAAIFAMAATLLLVTTLALLLALAMTPRADFEFVEDEAGLAIDGKSLPRNSRVEIVPPGDAPAFAMTAEQLLSYWEPRGSREERRQFFDDRDRVAALIAEGGGHLRLADGGVRSMGLAQPKPFVAPSVLVIIFAALVSALVSLWFLSIRPAEPAARAFAACGLSFYVNSLVMAALLTVNPAISGQDMAWLLQANYLFGMLIGLSLIDLFGRYPLALVHRRWLRAMWIGAPAVWGSLWLADIDHLYGWYDGLIVLIALTIILLVVCQVRASRGQPDIMAALRWMGSTLLLSIVSALILNFLPQMNGQPLVGTVAIVITIFALFFLSLGMAIMRYRLFDLGRWATQVARTAMVLVVLLLLDVAVALMVGSSRALTIALLVVVALWWPLREYALRRAERARGVENLQLMRYANRIVFARSREEQAAHWQAVLQTQFDPLTAVPHDADAVALIADGQSLRVPSPLGTGATLLTFAGKGARLFHRGDVAMARNMVRLVTELAQAREAYDRGAQSERSRIARDLHDDVGARLMTSLYRADVQDMQSDIRHAMADMRSIIDGLVGRVALLADSLSDLRHEAVSRLQLAGIVVDAPLPEVPDSIDEPVAIDGGAHRALHSVARELVSNIIRHSDASKAWIMISLHDGTVRLQIGDNGRGVSAHSTGRTGHGLTNARKRLSEMGGRLDLDTSDRGTSIVAEIPVRSPKRAMGGTDEGCDQGIFME